MRVILVSVLLLFSMLFCVLINFADLQESNVTKTKAKNQASTIKHDRAKFNYQMSCQGCHTPTGQGFQSVPKLKGFLGNFLQTPEGREYLIKVPGAAYSPLTDKELAEVINWMLLTFAEDSLSSDWEVYTATEVAKFRKDPLLETQEYRNNLLQSFDY